MNRNTRVLVQGITGREGSFHTKNMKEYGTKIVAGVTPGRGGAEVEGVPVYNTVAEAVKEHEIDASVIFVPARYAADAVYEAVDSEIKLIVVITEHIPVLDTMRFVKYSRRRGVRVIGPNCPGIMKPEETSLGIMPRNSFRKGKIGIASRSGTLTYEVANSVKSLGQSIVIGIGGDPIVGTDLAEAVQILEADPETEEIVLVGEIGGTAEERISEMVRRGDVKKRLVAYIAGLTAPREKRMGHAGAVVYMGKGTYESKVKALTEAGVPVARTPYEIPDLL